MCVLGLVLTVTIFISGVACQVQSGPDPGLLGAQARDLVCLLEIKHAAFSFTKRESVQNH